MKCGLIRILVELSSSSYTALCGSLVTQRQNGKASQNVETSKKMTFDNFGMKRHNEVGQKICGQNVTDFQINSYSESKCHTVTNHPNFLSRNITILDERTIRPL